MGLLELGLELGLVGVGLALLSLAKALRDAMLCFQYAHSDVVNWYVGLLALTVSYNVDEAFLARENFLPWLLYLVACTGLAEEARKVAAAKALMARPLIGLATPAAFAGCGGLNEISMPTVYHLLTESEPFSEQRGGAISRWVANVVRKEQETVVAGAFGRWIVGIRGGRCLCGGRAAGVQAV